MTVSYSADVATESFSVFWKILIRWKGTVYKILWREFLLFVMAYLVINLTYRFGLKSNADTRRNFQTAVYTCQKIADGIPIAFILGFYITVVVNRFWSRYDTLPWPDTLGFSISAFIMGQDERSRLLRRTIIRYVNIAFILLMRQIATSAKKRFPTVDHLVIAGVMSQNEKEAYDKIKCAYPKWWIPLAWCNTLICLCRKEGRIQDEYAFSKLIDEVTNYNETCRRTFDYDWVCIPLVYTQVVIIAVYSYFLTNLMAKQLVDLESAAVAKKDSLFTATSDTEFSYLSSIFFLFQFLFYMGWLKIAATIFNPFGEDDDDFEINFLIDRNLRIGYVFVDEMHNEHPELIKDSFWDQKDVKLPYTAAAAQSEKEVPMGSAVNVKVAPEDALFLPLQPIPEETNINAIDIESYVLGPNRQNVADNVAPSTTTVLKGKSTAKPVPIGLSKFDSNNLIAGSLDGPEGSVSMSLLRGMNMAGNKRYAGGPRGSIMKRIGSMLKVKPSSTLISSTTTANIFAVGTTPPVNSKVSEQNGITESKLDDLNKNGNLTTDKNDETSKQVLLNIGEDEKGTANTNPENLNPIPNEKTKLLTPETDENNKTPKGATGKNDDNINKKEKDMYEPALDDDIFPFDFDDYDIKKKQDNKKK